MGLLLHAIVHSAGIQDRDGGIALLATLFGRFPFLAKLFADSAYQGPIFGSALAKILPCLETEIIRRSDQAKGFVRLPKRWIVERTIAWLNRCRRLAKDWENLNRNALAFLKLASIRLMLKQAKSESPSDIVRWLQSEAASLWPAILGSLSLRRSPCVRENCARTSSKASAFAPASRGASRSCSAVAA